MLEKNGRGLSRQRDWVDRRLYLEALQVETAGTDSRQATVIPQSEAFPLMSNFRKWLTEALSEVWEDEMDDVDPALVGTIYRKIQNEADYLLPEELTRDFPDV